MNAMKCKQESFPNKGTVQCHANNVGRKPSIEAEHTTIVPWFYSSHPVWTYLLLACYIECTKWIGPTVARHCHLYHKFCLVFLP